MQQLPTRPPNPIERFLGLLGAGILGTVSFVLISILLLPLMIVLVPYTLYVRWKIKRQVRNLTEQMNEAFGGMEGIMAGMGPGGVEQADGSAVEDAPPAGRRGRKHVDVTVKTVGFEDNAPDADP
jgi:hypothetical protein